MRMVITVAAFLCLSFFSFESHASDSPFDAEISSLGSDVYSLSIKRIEKLKKPTHDHDEEIDNLSGAYMIVKCHETGKAHSILDSSGEFGVSENIKFQCDKRKLHQGIRFLRADECEKLAQFKIVADACKVQHLYMNISP